MLWNLAPIIIAVSSIILTTYIFKITKKKRFFWSSLTLSGTNLIGGWNFALYINFILGLILFLVPLLILLHAFYNYKKGDQSFEA